MSEYRGKHHHAADAGSTAPGSSDFHEPATHHPRPRSSRRADPNAVKSLNDAAPRPRHSKRRTLLTVLIIVIIAVGLAFGGVKVFGMLDSQAAGIKPGQQVSVTIQEGWGTSDIAKYLRTQGVISNENDFKTVVSNHHAESTLKPGNYSLTTGMDLDSLVTSLVNGPLLVDTDNKLTIPEGYTVEQTAAAVESACGIPSDQFLALAYSADSYVSDYPFLADAYNNSLEGFLYPKTYSIPKGASADYVIRVLLDQFVTETASLDMTYATAHNLTYYDVITLASLIEKETAASSERPLVSSVIYNRLHLGMRLQIDATVVYALGPDYDGHPLLYTDLEVDSPYNTYIVDQLPAGPICSPQIASITAAANPAQTDYLYYVLTSKDGFHTFCETSDEFEEAKAVYNQVFGVQ